MQAVRGSVAERSDEAETATVQVLTVSRDIGLARAVTSALPSSDRIARCTEPARLGAAIARWRPDIVLLDVDSPPGVLLIEEARVHPGLGIVGLTRARSVDREVEVFQGGADDWVVVPFGPVDLRLRVRAILRRLRSLSVMPRLRVGDIEVDLLARGVTVGGRSVHVTALEQAVLYLLAAAAGAVLSRDQILAALWGVESEIESNVVDQHVRTLRAKLRDDWRQPRYIETVAGRGYRFLAPGCDAGALADASADTRLGAWRTHA